MGDNLTKIVNGIQLIPLSSGPSGVPGQIWYKNSSNSLRFEGMNLELTQQGKIRINEAGGLPSLGVATLVAGTVTVSNTSISVNSRIFLTTQTPGGTPGYVYVSARSAGVSFTITSISALDTSDVAYLIIEAF